MQKPSPLFIAPFLLFFLACSSGGTSAAAGDSSPAPREETRSSPNLITRAELAEASELNAFEVVQRMRGTWLRVRGQTTLGGAQPQGIKVYVNGSRRGGLTELRRFRATDIESLRWISGREASGRYGTDHGDGVIMVTLRAR